MITAPSQISAVTELLAGYAARGVFRGFSAAAARGDKAAYRVLWHRNQTFDVTFDPATGRFCFPRLFANVPAGSPMYQELKEFVRSRGSGDLPEHRRIDSDKAQAKVSNRRGTISLVVEAKAGECEYGARKLIHLVHEIFMTFLVEGNYFEYMVEAFDLDPDRM
jgi:hypothetical protein